jgi:hypothetical protein
MECQLQNGEMRIARFGAIVPERSADSWQLVAVGPIEGARVAMVAASSVRVVGCPARRPVDPFGEEYPVAR